MEAVTTERLAFKQPELADGDALFERMNDFDIVKFLTSVPWPYRRADADAYIERARSGRAEGNGHYYLVLDKATRAILGTVDLRFDPEETAHFGYWYAKAAWGRGYASEALTALLDFGFGSLGLRNIWGAAMPQNPASIRVMEKCGLTDVGRIEVERPNFGDAVEMVKLNMRRADWLARSGGAPA
ncbi:GNAT family N-acetyltransferase [Nisaea acidiphila]|uniref:GNAT family N-acetyltransferase n=1 Tax=Nisaea acidiphila TaxID=1862145 RepID=A0A9J7AVP5_9PROT|nr:GNAT family N-acetyltransferase [Nisaea acidiphila]UUX51407.1 GNAT family N-acetyltransferase [Nisaea acidiphila]